MSRELDALVAEKVMGYTMLGTAHCCQSGDDGRWSVMGDNKPSSDSREMPVYRCPEYDGRDEEAREALVQGVPACWCCVVDFYSSDIAAAWEVVENLRHRCAQVDVWACGPTFNRCYIHSFHEGIEWKDGHIESDAAGEERSPMLAICLAALRAVGVPDAEITKAQQGGGNG